MRIERVVIAGSGLAGVRTAEELRARGYQGSITMVGAEHVPPYDRPPLTKKFMTGEIDDVALTADLGALGVDVRLGEVASGVTVAGRESAAAGAGAGLLVAGSAGFAFDALVVATGATPVRLPGPGRQRVLRTLGDAREIRAALRPGVRLAVVGAGWIGAELATAAVGRGCQVSVVEAAPAPLAAALGTDAGSRTSSWYAEAGVDLMLGRQVESVEPGGLALTGGQWIAADEIVTAVGVRPEVGWLAGSRIVLANGVVVDEGLRASAPGVFAVGDCAAFYSRRYHRRLRVEHWDNALHAPEVAAANILGGDEIYDPVPYFWSEQFGRMVQYAGHHTGEDRLVWRGDPTGRAWAACWLAGPAPQSAPGAPVPAAGGRRAPAASGRPAGGPAPSGDRVAAVLAVGRPRDLVQGRRLIASGAFVDPRLVADPAIPLREAAIDGATAGG